MLSTVNVSPSSTVTDDVTVDKLVVVVVVAVVVVDLYSASRRAS